MRLKKTVGYGVLLAAAAFGLKWAQAADYGMAGCGLGSLLFEENDFSQVIAATTNGTSGSQTFGITSGTSNCSSGGALKSEKAREVFVAVNFKDIAREMAAGKGEFVSALGVLSGCGAQALPSFLTLVQSNYATLLPSEATGPEEMLSKLDAAIAADGVLSKSCKA